MGMAGDRRHAKARGNPFFSGCVTIRGRAPIGHPSLLPPSTSSTKPRTQPSVSPLYSIPASTRARHSIVQWLACPAPYSIPTPCCPLSPLLRTKQKASQKLSHLESSLAPFPLHTETILSAYKSPLQTAISIKYHFTIDTAQRLSDLFRYHLPA